MEINSLSEFPKQKKEEVEAKSNSYVFGNLQQAPVRFLGPAASPTFGGDGGGRGQGRR
jgi:hypothetical protein